MLHKLVTRMDRNAFRSLVVSMTDKGVIGDTHRNSRKRKRDESSWKINKTKMARERSVSYISHRGILIPEKTSAFRETLCHCKFECNDNLCDQNRKDIFIRHFQRHRRVSFKQPATDDNKAPFPPCASCGLSSHRRVNCYYRNAICYACHRQGHVQKICRSSRQ